MALFNAREACGLDFEEANNNALCNDLPGVEILENLERMGLRPGIPGYIKEEFVPLTMNGARPFHDCQAINGFAPPGVYSTYSAMTLYFQNFILFPPTGNNGEQVIVDLTISEETTDESEK